MKHEWTLDRLGPGVAGRVSALLCPEPMGQRLRELGLTEGTVVRCVGRSPLGDPLAYRVRGAVLALRRSDGRLIRVETPKEGGPA